MKRICVFCGSNVGVLPEYVQVARKFGKLLARQQIGLVYGGASIGLMGEIANTVLGEGGEVIGVIPKTIQRKEFAHPGLSDLHVVNSMHERKALMAKLADGFVALPGGIGTMDEFFEIWTWAQLGLHKKPCGILNIAHYYEHLIVFIHHMINQGFLLQAHHAMLIVEKEPEQLLERFNHYQPLVLDKWQVEI